MGAGLAAAALAILFGFSGVAHAQSGSGTDETTSTTTATTVFSGVADDTLANTGADTWLLISGAGVAMAGAVGARRLLRSRTV
jgi:hypothetical protein